MAKVATIRVNVQAIVAIAVLKKHIKIGIWLATVFPECNASTVQATYLGSHNANAPLQVARSERAIKAVRKLIKKLDLPVTIPVVTTHRDWVNWMDSN